MLGGDKDVLKIDGRYLFDESEAPVIFFLMSQLHTGEGIIAEFVNSHKDNEPFSANAVLELTQALYDEASKSDTKDQEILEQLAQFIESIFLNSPLYWLETCHDTLNTFATELRDLPYNDQSILMKKIRDIFRKECELLITDSTKKL